MAASPFASECLPMRPRGDPLSAAAGASSSHPGRPVCRPQGSGCDRPGSTGSECPLTITSSTLFLASETRIDVPDGNGSTRPESPGCPSCPLLAVLASGWTAIDVRERAWSVSIAVVRGGSPPDQLHERNSPSLNCVCGNHISSPSFPLPSVPSYIIILIPSSYNKTIRWYSRSDASYTISPCLVLSRDDDL
jgi:hypothetical protein